MAEPLSQAERAALRANHVRRERQAYQWTCPACWTGQPCDVVRLLDALDAAEVRAERAEADALACTSTFARENAGLAKERDALRAQVARLEATLKIIAETPVEKHYSQFHFARNLAQEALAAAQQGGASEH